MTDQTDRLAQALADRYTIERELGAGGMATVYLAEDVKHHRKVAVKVLRPELAAVLGADRFVQEIETTANLQHPHILPLFDSGESDGFLYYVMPFIDGETLRDKLNRETQLGIEEAVRITTEVADALDYAHRHNVIHRDVKPENILLHDGRPMVADFGIALAVSAAAGGRLTETGMSLGTPHYMSPEQATAEKDITHRSDIYSLSTVLYEMLTGEPPHTGSSAQAIIMKIVTEPAAPVTKIRKSVPPNVAAATAKSLEILPADRFENAKAFADALTNPSFAVPTMYTASTVLARTGGPWKRVAIAAIALASLFFFAAAWSWLKPQPSPPVYRYGLAWPTTQAPIPQAFAPTPAPDGSFLVYHGPAPTGVDGQLWLKRRNEYTAAPIPGTVGAQSFDISPDRESIVFAREGEMIKVAVTGGGAVTLTSGVRSSAGVVWLDDNTIVYAVSDPPGQLGRISANGGESTVVLTDSVAVFPLDALPNGRGVLFARCITTGCDMWAIDLRDGRVHSLVQGSWGQYATTGHLVYVQDGALFAVRFDADAMEVLGAPVSLGDGVSNAPNSVRLSASGTLTILYGAVGMESQYTIVWVDRTGRTTPVDTSWIFNPLVAQGNSGWSLSLDESRVAIGLASDAGDDIWVKQLPRGPVSRITFDTGNEFRPRWTPDGQSIVFGADGREFPGLYQRRADGTGTDSLLVAGTVSEGVWHPDGEWLLLRTRRFGPAAGGRDITGIRRGIDTAEVPVLATRFDEEAIMPSPDGRWFAYQSDETGQTEVFIRPFPDVDSGKWQVSSGGGEGPLWSRDGRELFWLSSDNTMMAVQVTIGTTLRLGDPEVLFRVPDELRIQELGRYYTQWDVATDGRFLMTQRVESNNPDKGAVIIVENFLEELKTKVGN